MSATATKILAADVGFVATGLAVLEIRPGLVGEAVPIELVCVRPPDAGKERKRTTYKAHLDAERAAYHARELDRILHHHQIQHVVAELPSSGAKGARANRCMALATAGFVAVMELRRLSVEYYTPDQTRWAALGRKKRQGEDIKEIVTAAMAARFPSWAGLTKKVNLGDLEHLADALATYEAAKDGPMVRALLAPYGQLEP